MKLETVFYIFDGRLIVEPYFRAVDPEITSGKLDQRISVIVNARLEPCLIKLVTIRDQFFSLRTSVSDYLLPVSAELSEAFSFDS